MRSQGFVSAYDEHHKHQKDKKWVSHLNHENKAVGVDCIWLLNPSMQSGSLSANWRKIAFAHITSQLILNGHRTQRETFRFFAQSDEGVFTQEQFIRALQVPDLGLTGPGSAGFMPHELHELAEALDDDDDWLITEDDMLRWLDVEAGVKALQALDWKVKEYLIMSASTTCPVACDPHLADVEIVSASLPGSFAEGVWPEGYQDEISDHAPLSGCFTFPDTHSAVGIRRPLPATRISKPPTMHHGALAHQ
jgi:hypothetical protein